MKTLLSHPSKMTTLLCRRLSAWACLLVFALPAFCAVPRDYAPASDLVQQGLEAYLDQDYDKAVGLFEQALDVDKRSKAARQGLKSARKKLKEIRERQKALERPAFHFAELYYERGDLVEAIDRVRAILARQPDSARAQGLADKIKKRAQKSFDAAQPDSNDWFYMKGVLAYLSDDWFQAAQLWEQVFAFNPDEVQLESYIARAKQNEEAKQKLERMDMLKRTAWNYLQDGNYDEAIKTWKDLLVMDPGNTTAREGILQAREAAATVAQKEKEKERQELSQKAMDLYIDRDYKGSLALWKKILEKEPDNVMAKDYVKRIGSRSRESYSYGYPSYGGGTSYPSEPSRSSYSSNTPNGYQKAMEYMKKEDYSAAVESLERYMNRHPDDAKARSAMEDARRKQDAKAESLYQKGLEAYSLGNAKAAIKQWQAALKVNSDYQRARLALIKAMAEANKQ